MATTEQILQGAGVELWGELHLGLGDPPATFIEPPICLYDGQYDVEFIGAYSYMGGHGARIRHVRWIGRFCAIATNVIMGEAQHSAGHLSAHPLFEGIVRWAPQTEAFRTANAAMIAKAGEAHRTQSESRYGKIEIGNDVWIGEGALIQRGVKIGDGAVVGSRAVVTRDVPPYAIVAGSPARIIRYRFEPEVIAELLRLSWWTYGLSALDGVDFTDIGQALARIADNIESGRAQAHEGPLVRLNAERQASVWVPDPERGLVQLDDSDVDALLGIG